METADEALVFYDQEALKIKQRQIIPPDAIAAAFDHPNLRVFSVPQELHDFLYNQNYAHTVLLMMSSGNYGQLDWDRLVSIVSNA